MNKGITLIILAFIINTEVNAEFSQLHTNIIKQPLTTNTYDWKIERTAPFKELVMSWNSLRPSEGHLSFYISLRHSKSSKWSESFKLCEWGPDFQRTTTNKNNPYIHTNDDSVTLRGDSYGTGFRITVVAENDADLSNLAALFATTTNPNHFQLKPVPSMLESVYIEKVPGKSQRVLNHPRKNDLCSPTSVCIVIDYFNLLAGNIELIDPVAFADKVKDDTNDIYGNWSLNVAEAYNASEGKVLCAATRLNSFEELHSHLLAGCPVVVSVKNPTDGIKYKSSHLMTVIGWNQEKQKVICINTAFYPNEGVEFAYDLEDFLQAWSIRRNNVAYIFYPL